MGIKKPTSALPMRVTISHPALAKFIKRLQAEYQIGAYARIIVFPVSLHYGLVIIKEYLMSSKVGAKPEVDRHSP